MYIYTIFSRGFSYTELSYTLSLRDYKVLGCLVRESTFNAHRGIGKILSIEIHMSVYLLPTLTLNVLAVKLYNNIFIKNMKS